MFGLQPLLVVVVFAALVLVSGLKILREYERAVIFRLGRIVSHRGPGIIYVFGQKRVSHVFNPPRTSSIRQLQFCDNRLIALDSKNDVSVFSLETGKLIASYAPPGHVMALVSDPSLGLVDRSSR